MKNIEFVKEFEKKNIRFLKEFQNERRTQANDGNANPVFWVLMDYKWEITENGYEDRVSICSVEDGETTPAEDYINEILNKEHGSDFTKHQVKELEEILEWNGYDGLIEWTQENTDDNYYLIYEKEIAFIVPNTLFLTKSEAKKHIKLYNYNYTSKVHTYAMTALRSPVLEELLNILETSNWDALEKQLINNKYSKEDK